MKVWRFYLRRENSESKNKYELYAVTNNKKYAKKFMSERNMKLFQVKCSDIPKEEFLKFGNENRGCLLDYKEFITKKINSKNEYTHTTVKVLTTEYEWQSCDSDIVLNDILIDTDWTAAVPYKIYKDKIIKSLRVLEYVSSYKLYSYDSSLIDPEDDDYSAPDMWVDELGTFLRIYGETFK